MSKGIFLYSEDKKYKCAFELSDSVDQFKCPDHSVMILFEERENGTYVIAQARDKILETEKDKKITDLEAKLAESEQENKDLEDDHNKLIEQYNKQYNELCKEINVHSSARERLVKKVKELKQQLAEKEKEVQRTHNYYQAVRNRETIQESKLDFAIAELEKVRKEFETKLTGCKWEDKMLVGKFCNTTNEILDNKIEELKEMKSE